MAVRTHKRDKLREGPFIGTILEARRRHEWLVYNEGILHGYRINYHSYKELLKSTCQCHNETTNIWTHLLGALLFFGVLVLILTNTQAAYLPNQRPPSQHKHLPALSHNLSSVLSSLCKNKGVEIDEQRLEKIEGRYWEVVGKVRDSGNLTIARELASKFITEYKHELDSTVNSLFATTDLNKCSDNKETIQSSISSLSTSMIINLEQSIPSPPDQWMIKIFLLCTILCYIASSYMHTFWVKSARISSITHDIDLSGISINIFGASASLVHYVFECNPIAYWTYILTQTVTLFCILLGLNVKSFRSSRFDLIKVLLYIVQVLISLLATIHWALFGYADMHSLEYKQNIMLFLLEIGLLAIGTVFFVTRFPECRYPGRFDLFLSSHTIFHTFIVLGAIAHYMALLKLYNSRQYLSCPLIYY